ncbi:MAG TPA: hypothetical protein PKL58_09675 [Methylophilaceae bacterium]|nr:hypothetical protein [Methylophilaceae bacterium]
MRAFKTAVLIKRYFTLVAWCAKSFYLDIDDAVHFKREKGLNGVKNLNFSLRMLLSSVVLPCKPLFIRLAGQHFSLGQFTVDLNKN